MDDKKAQQLDRIRRYGHIIEKQSGQSVSGLSRYDGYVNLLNRYGTSKDTQENYHYMPEAAVPDELLVQFYEGNGLFAKIIDTPADEALKHGFELVGIKDQNIIDFYQQALEELDWEETASQAIRWARLFGGSIAVMLINDGRGIDEPLDWSRIKSIDDIRVYDRSVIQPDYQSLFTFNSKDPFKTRGSRLGEPEYYCVYSKYGSFVVHSSRCLVFRNGSLPENTTNSIYELWGMPEYIRIHRAIRDTELAHSNAPKMLEKSVQAIYKVKNLSELLATQEGEDMVLKRLQIIDLARGILNSMAIDADGEEYDFRSFQYTGVSEIIDTTCNLLSALTSIPQTILFGRSPAGMNATGASDMENYYSFVGKIQNRMLKSNLRYLLSVIFQAGLYTGEIQEVPKIKPQFTPLFTLSEAEQATIEQTRASTQQIKATTTQMYVDMQVLDPGEVRKKLAEDDEYDVENVLGEMSDEELFENYGDEIEENAIPQQENPEGAQSADAGQEEGNAPDAAPEATKLPQDMDKAEIVKDRAVNDISKEKDSEKKQELDGKSHQSRMDAESVDDLGVSSVGLLVIKDGKILCGRRKDKNTKGQICGPGGHVEEGETAVYSVIRETDEEFGIIPTEIIPLGYGPAEKNGLQPYIFICTAYDGKPECDEVEMTGASFRSLEELYNIKDELFKPFADSLDILTKALNENPDNSDGGPGSGNFGHKGVPGQVGGSAPSGKVIADSLNKECRKADDEYFGAGYYDDGKKRITKAVKNALSDMSYGSKLRIKSDQGADWSVEKVGGNLTIVTRTGSDFGEIYPDFQIEEEYAESYFDTDSLITNEVDEPKDRTTGLEKLTLDELEEYIRKKEHEVFKRPQQEWVADTELLLRELGLTKPPTTLSKQDFDDYVKATGATVMKRGVSDDIDDSSGDITKGAEQIVYEFAHGTDISETHMGGGNYGSGHHFWSSPDNLENAKGFAHFYHALEDEDGAVITCAIKPTAKFMKMSEAKKFYEPTAYAIAQGYDGVMDDDGQVTNIANREVLVMKEPEPSDFVTGEKGYQKYVQYLKSKKSSDKKAKVSNEDGLSFGKFNPRMLSPNRNRGYNDDGGPGSGNFGHKGVEGQVGGSAPSGKSSAEWKSKLDSQKADLLSQGSNEQARQMYNLGVLDLNTALAQMKDGSISKTVDSYFDIMQANGDPTPTKKTVSSQRSLYDVVDSEYGGDWSKARVGEIIKDTGVSESEAEDMKREISDVWTTGSWSNAKSEVLDKYVENAPTYEGTIYRGMHFTSPEDYDDFMSQIQTGSVKMKGNSSWTSDKSVARRFSHMSQDDIDSVEIKCIGNRTAAPIDHLVHSNGGEDEVLAHSKAAWSVLSVAEFETKNGGRKAVITIVEKGEFEDE